MINIYKQPTEKDPSFGFTFQHFSSESIGMDYQTMPSKAIADAYIQESKFDCVLFNLECFHTFANKVLSPMDQVQEESQTALQNVILKWLNHKDKYEQMLADVVKNANFMRALVRPMPEKRKPAGIMMAMTLLQYCKAELDEYEKNKNKD